MTGSEGLRASNGGLGFSTPRKRGRGSVPRRTPVPWTEGSTVSGPVSGLRAGTTAVARGESPAPALAVDLGEDAGLHLSHAYGGVEQGRDAGLLAVGHRRGDGMEVRWVPLAVRREPPPGPLTVVAHIAPHLSRTAQSSLASEHRNGGLAARRTIPLCRGRSSHHRPNVAVAMSRHRPGSVLAGAGTSLGVRQDRARRPRARLERARIRARRQRGHGQSPRDGRDRPSRSGPCHRVPRDVGRARKDLAPVDPCRHPGRPLAPVPSRGPCRPGHHRHRPRRVQPVPVRDGAFCRDDRRGRLDDDPGRGEELRPRHSRRPPRRLRGRLGGAARGRRRERAHTSQIGAGRFRPQCRLRRRHRPLARRERARGRGRDRTPARDAAKSSWSAPKTSATGRTPIKRPLSTECGAITPAGGKVPCNTVAESFPT